MTTYSPLWDVLSLLGALFALLTSLSHSSCSHDGAHHHCPGLLYSTIPRLGPSGAMPCQPPGPCPMPDWLLQAGCNLSSSDTKGDLLMMTAVGLPIDSLSATLYGAHSQMCTAAPSGWCQCLRHSASTSSLASSAAVPASILQAPGLMTPSLI